MNIIYSVSHSATRQKWANYMIQWFPEKDHQTMKDSDLYIMETNQ